MSTAAGADDPPGRAARTVIARKGVLATTVGGIAAEADRSAASFGSHHDSHEALVRRPALRFRDEANPRAPATAYWDTQRNRFAEITGASRPVMTSDDFPRHGSETCSIPISFIAETARRAQARRHCPDDRAIYTRGEPPN